MLPSVIHNKLCLSWQGQRHYSRSQNKNICVNQDLTFEFFHVTLDGLEALNIENVVHQDALEQFVFLLSLDFASVLDYNNDQLRHLANVLDERFKGNVEYDFKTEWESLDLKKKKRIFSFFGGGVDSTAICKLYPEAHKIVLDTTPYSSYSLKEGDIFVKTNLKSSAFNPKGFVVWSQPFCVAPIISALYTADDCIYLLGSILGSSYLQNGNKYFDREARSNPRYGVTGNYYHSIFNELNIRLYAPLANCSELISTKIAYRNQTSNLAYCQSNSGYPCLRCFKCLRKNVEQEYLKLPSSQFKSVIAQIAKKDINFDYFSHIWQFVALNSFEISNALESQGLVINQEHSVPNLLRIYSKFERFYQDLEFSQDKLQRLQDFGIEEANDLDHQTIKNYTR